MSEDHLTPSANPPELVPINQLDDYADLDALQARIDTLFESYRHSLYDDRRWVFDHLRYQDAARKVVGVGSVGQRAWTSVWIARDIDDPMMIQMKTTPSPKSSSDPVNCRAEPLSGQPSGLSVGEA